MGLKTLLDGFKELIWIAGLGVVVTVWLNDRYATAEEVHRLESSLQKHQDADHAEIMHAFDLQRQEINSLRDGMRIISQRVFDLAKNPR